MKQKLKHVLLVLLFALLFKINPTYAQDLYISSGVTFELGGLTFELPGDWENYGTFVSGTGTVVLNGGTLQRVTNPSGENFFSLRLENANTSVVFNDDVHIESSFYGDASNTVNLGGNLLELGAEAILGIPQSSLTDSTGLGEVSYLGNLSDNVVDLGIKITTTADMGETNIKWGLLPYAVKGMQSISRYYDIIPTNNSDLNATLVFNYLESELNGLDESKLEFFMSTDGGTNWKALGGITNTVENSVTINGLNSLAKFTLGTDLQPPIITLTDGDSIIVNRFSGEFIDPGYTVIDNYDETPQINITGTVNTYLPGDYQLTYTATDNTGNSSISLRNVKVVEDPNALTNPYLYLADKEIKLDKMNGVDGDLHSNDKIEIKKGPATYKSNLTAIGKISIDKDITIDGDVISNDKIKIDKDVLINGNTTENASLIKNILPSLSFATGGENIKSKKNETVVLTPGSYKKVDIDKGGKLEFSSGEYFIKELKIGNDVNIVMNLSTGPIEINVKKKIDIDKNCTTTLLPLGDADSRYVNINALGDININEGTKLLGTLCAPNSKIHLKKSVQFYGSLCAKKIDVDKEVVSVYHHIQNTQTSTALAVGSKSDDLDKHTEIIEQKILIPDTYELSQNYPNPFNPTTTIRFGLPEDAFTKLEIFNILGQRQMTLIEGMLQAGYYNFTFDAKNLSSGIYIYRITAGEPSGGSKKGLVETKKMVLVK